MVIDIVKATRDGEHIRVTFNEVDLPERKLAKQTRRLKHLYKAARDSVELPKGYPIAIISGVSFPMTYNVLTSTWSLRVTSHTDMQVNYDGVLYELGVI